LTGTPVTRETVFEAASISKVITAYAALRLVDEGSLSLDTPVHTYLDEPWLPPSEYANLITTRHLLSHSSGLLDDPLLRKKTLVSKPGARFRYSGMGFLYAQHVAEQLAGGSLEALAQELVFRPLSMSSSSFVGEDGVMSHMANGHMSYLLLLLFSLFPFSVLMVASCAVALPISRITTGRWRPSIRLILILSAISLAITGATLYLAIGEAFPNLLGASVLCVLGFVAGVIVSWVAFRRLAVLLPATWHSRRGLLALLRCVWMALALILLLGIAGYTVGPVPTNASMDPGAVGSLRASAPDLATFLIELADPRYLKPEIAAQIGTVQIEDNESFSWGLGIGIQHSAHGDALWQNAITLAFRGIMAIYPEHGHGVVVLTNSASGLPVAYDVAERALGGKAAWKHF
jgi:CubicO group peptidase (beta-lactamase class C family)